MALGNGQSNGAVSRHGKPLRGLMSTTSSRNYQGRFGRIFRALPEAQYGATDEKSRAALMRLGEAMTAGTDKPKDGFDPEESGIPALYTYFGQFVDHDITFDPITTLVRHSDPDALTDFRTPALDLDSVYGRGPDDQPYMYKSDGKGGCGPELLLGKKLENGARDLPRNNDEPRRALVGDPRNDENAIVSQFQGLMLRFHNRVAEDNRNWSLPEVQEFVRFHYQWVVLHDFLPRIVSDSVLKDLKEGGKFSKDKLKFFHWRNDPFMPVEFSVAAYRFGHSMVRPGYRLNNDDTTLRQVFGTASTIRNETHKDLAGFREIASNEGIDWGRFIDIDLRSYGTDKPTDESTKRRLQFAYRIDTSLVAPLSHLPREVVQDQPPSLPQRNLIRGFELGLPTGQAVARVMGVKPLEDDEIILGKAVDKPENGDVRGTINQIRDLKVFEGNCPLWTYILAEAFATPVKVTIPVTEKNMQISTPQLGPVGGRIVAEVILGLLVGDKYSQLNSDPRWTPQITEGGDFRLKDLVRYALDK